MAVSPDGTRLLRVGREGVIAELLDAATGRLLRQFYGHSSVYPGPSQIQSLTFTSDAAKVVSAAGDQTVRVWDAASGRAERILDAHSRWIQSLAFSADGEQVSTQGLWMEEGARTLVWDVRTGTLQRTYCRTDRPFSYSYGESGIRIAARSADGRWVVEVAGEEGEVRLRDEKTGAIRRIFDHGPENRIAVETGEVYGAFSPDGGLVATWLGNHAVRRYPRVWDISDLTLGIVRIAIRQAGDRLELSWPSGQLQTALELSGPWTAVREATSPHWVQPSGQRTFYRAQQE